MQDQPLQYKFGKNEKLCSQKQIDLLFSKGKWLHGRYIKAVRLLLDEEPASHPRVLISIPKKSFRKAVVRNRIRRRIREAYRLNKQALCESAVRTGKQLITGFVFSHGTELDYAEIENDLRALLQQIASKLKQS